VEQRFSAAFTVLQLSRALAAEVLCQSLTSGAKALNQIRFCNAALKRCSTLSLLAASLATISGCRQDMHDQPRYKPLAQSDFYPDQRSARAPVEGTVARGQLREDVYFYTGKIGNNPGDFMPFPVSEEVLIRGRERFNIYCAPCHSRLGDGNGVVPSRGFPRKPPSYHIERLRKAPLGYFFDVITNGFGIMPDYASQIPPGDRWRIIAYIRALQLSQGASMTDVPAGQKVPSELPIFEEPGSGATLPRVEPKPANPKEGPE
jgi:mono/diheme cytochrome c family protein